MLTAALLTKLTPFLLGGWLWIWQQSKKKITPALLYLLALALLLRLVLLFQTPLFYAPDEEAHFNYIRYLALKKKLPTELHRTNSRSKDWEYYQPPLYYLLLAPLYKVVHHWQPRNLSLQVYSLRLVSLFFALATAYFSSRLLWSQRNPFPALAVLLFFLFLPSYLFLSVMINNDNLLFLLTALALYLLAEDNWGRQRSLLLGLVLGLSFLTKLSAIVPVAVVFFYWGLKFISSPAQRRELLQSFIFLFLLAGTGLALVFWRNYYSFKLWNPEAVVNVPVYWASYQEAWQRTLPYLRQTFWAAAGIYNNLRFWPHLNSFLLSIAAGGWLILFFLRWKKENLNVFPLGLGKNKFFLALSAGLILNLLLLARFAWLYRQGQGRFLYPSLLISAWFLLRGWTAGFYFLRWRSRWGWWGALGLFFLYYALHFVTFNLVKFSQL